MMEMLVPTFANNKLATFNNLALHYQDEAFTLAYYLLGDETRATEATQAAFSEFYRRASLRLDGFRLEILRWVLAACRSTGGLLTTGMVRDDLTRQLLSLKGDERSALVLVDVLGLGYEEAGQVLGCSKKQMTRLVAQARLSLKSA